jgi:hypothetical protein
MSTASSSTSRDKVRQHRERLRAHGLRPVQFWVPDTRSDAFRAEAQRQALGIAASTAEPIDQALVDAVSDWPDK